MQKEKRTVIGALTLGIFLALCCEIGRIIDSPEEMSLSNAAFYFNLCWKTFSIASLLWISWRMLQKAAQGAKQKVYSEKKSRILSSFWGRTILFLIMWTPSLLAVFPGAFAYDAAEQWRQVREWDLDSIHPIAHTLLVGGCLEGGTQLFGSYNAGIFLYTILQMFVLALIFSESIAFLERYRVRNSIRVAAFLFWGLSPVVQLFVVCTTKDIYFSGVMLILFLCLVDYSCKKESFLSSNVKKAVFVMSAFGVAVLRNNGLYIMLIILPMMFFLENKKESKRKLCPLLTVISALCILYLGPLYGILGVDNAGGQQICCPYRFSS